MPLTNLVDDVCLEGEGEQSVPHRPEAVAVHVAAAPPLLPVLPAAVLAVVVVRHVALQRGGVRRRRGHDCKKDRAISISEHYTAPYRVTEKFLLNVYHICSRQVGHYTVQGGAAGFVTGKG